MTPKQYLQSLEWDGIHRINYLLSDYFGASATPGNAMIGTAWMRSAVRRVMEPGCRVDKTLLLSGPQGFKKSKALQALAGEWHAEEPLTKDRLLAGAWIVEVPLTRDHMDLKAFFTRAADVCRQPYATKSEHIPRSFIAVATSNVAIKVDSRRFYIVKMQEPADPQKILEDRDELWAEAMVTEAVAA